jgi:hypothetical protein
MTRHPDKIQGEAECTEAYERAVASKQTHARYASVLLAAAITPSDANGFFAAEDVKEPLFRVSGKRYRIDGYKRHLNDFKTATRGQVLEIAFEGKHAKYRFRDRRLAMYILNRAKYEGRI